jgi:hypothetical protein
MCGIDVQQIFETAKSWPHSKTIGVPDVAVQYTDRAFGTL